MTYHSTAAFGKPAKIINPLSTGTDPDGWRRWWAAQSKIDGIDWTSLGVQAARVFWRIQLTSSVCWCSS